MMASINTQTRQNDKTFTIVRWLQDPVNSVVLPRPRVDPARIHASDGYATIVPESKSALDAVV
ncbi:MAG: hypothetical protein GQ526_00475 [Ardenticatenales bacterium]|nr:hypothetical protein [Ardenticatenales bacterium]